MSLMSGPGYSSESPKHVFIEKEAKLFINYHKIPSLISLLKYFWHINVKAQHDVNMPMQYLTAVKSKIDNF